MGIFESVRRDLRGNVLSALGRAMGLAGAEPMTDRALAEEDARRHAEVALRLKQRVETGWPWFPGDPM